MQRSDSLEKTLMLGKIESRRRRGQQRMRRLDGVTDSTDMSLSKLGAGDGQGSLDCCSPWGRKELDTTEWLNWTEQQSKVLTLVEFQSTTRNRETDINQMHNFFFSAAQFTIMVSTRKWKHRIHCASVSVCMPSRGLSSGRDTSDNYMSTMEIA